MAADHPRSRQWGDRLILRQRNRDRRFHGGGSGRDPVGTQDDAERARRRDGETVCCGFRGWVDVRRTCPDGAADNIGLGGRPEERRVRQPRFGSGADEASIADVLGPKRVPSEYR